MSDQPWFRGPDVNADGGALYPSLLIAFYGVSPVARDASGARWVMDLDWYKRIRAAFGIDPDDDDQDKWEPIPEKDFLFGVPITVTGDGGAPHIENRHIPADFDARPLPAHGGHRGAVRRERVGRPQVGRR